MEEADQIPQGSGREQHGGVRVRFSGVACLGQG
jgi:hypothetical protein